MASSEGAHSSNEAPQTAPSMTSNGGSAEDAASRRSLSDLFEEGAPAPLPRNSSDDRSFWTLGTPTSDTPTLSNAPPDQHQSQDGNADDRDSSGDDQLPTPTEYDPRRSSAGPSRILSRQNSTLSTRVMTHTLWSVDSFATQQSSLRRPMPGRTEASSPSQSSSSSSSPSRRHQLADDPLERSTPQHHPGLVAALEAINQAEVAVQGAKLALTKALEAKVSSGDVCSGCLDRVAATGGLPNGGLEAISDPRRHSASSSSSSSSSSSGGSAEDGMGDHLMAEDDVESPARPGPEPRSAFDWSTMSPSSPPTPAIASQADCQSAHSQATSSHSAFATSSSSNGAERNFARAEQDFRDLVKDWAHKNARGGAPSSSSLVSSQPMPPFLYDEAAAASSQWSPDDEEPTTMFRGGRNGGQQRQAQGDFESALSRLAPEGVIPSQLIDHSGRYLNLGGTQSDKIRLVQIPSPILANPLLRMPSDDDFASRSSHGGTISAQPSLRRISEEIEREEEDELDAGSAHSAEFDDGMDGLPDVFQEESTLDAEATAGIEVDPDSLLTPLVSPRAIMDSMPTTPRKTTHVDAMSSPQNDANLLSPSTVSHQVTPAGARVLGSLIQDEIKRTDTVTFSSESPISIASRHRALSFPPSPHQVVTRPSFSASSHEAARRSAIERWTSLVDKTATAPPAGSLQHSDSSSDRLVASRWSSSTSNFDVSSSHAGFQLRSDLSNDLAFGRSPDRTGHLVDVSGDTCSDSGLVRRRHASGPPLGDFHLSRPTSLSGNEIPPVTPNLKELRRQSLGGKSLSTVIQEAAAALKSGQTTPHSAPSPHLPSARPSRDLTIDVPSANTRLLRHSHDEIRVCASPLEASSQHSHVRSRSNAHESHSSPASPTVAVSPLGTISEAATSHSEATVKPSASASSSSGHWLGKRLQKAASHFTKKPKGAASNVGGSASSLHVLQLVRPRSRSFEDVRQQAKDNRASVTSRFALTSKGRGQVQMRAATYGSEAHLPHFADTDFAYDRAVGGQESPESPEQEGTYGSRALRTGGSEAVEELLPSEASHAGSSQCSVRRSELLSRSAAGSFLSRQLERTFLGRKEYHEDVIFEERTQQQQQQERRSDPPSSSPSQSHGPLPPMSASGETTPRPHTVAGMVVAAPSSSAGHTSPTTASEPLRQSTSPASRLDEGRSERFSGSGALSGCGDERGSMLFSLPPLLQDVVRESFDAESEDDDEISDDGPEGEDGVQPAEMDVTDRHMEEEELPVQAPSYGGSVASHIGALPGSSADLASTSRQQQRQRFSRSFPSLPSAFSLGRSKSERSPKEQPRSLPLARSPSTALGAGALPDDLGRRPGGGSMRAKDGKGRGATASAPTSAANSPDLHTRALPLMPSSAEPPGATKQTPPSRLRQLASYGNKKKRLWSSSGGGGGSDAHADGESRSKTTATTASSPHSPAAPLAGQAPWRARSPPAIPQQPQQQSPHHRAVSSSASSTVSSAGSGGSSGSHQRRRRRGSSSAGGKRLKIPGFGAGPLPSLVKEPADDSAESAAERRSSSQQAAVDEGRTSSSASHGREDSGALGLWQEAASSTTSQRSLKQEARLPSSAAAAAAAAATPASRVSMPLQSHRRAERTTGSLGSLKGIRTPPPPPSRGAAATPEQHVDRSCPMHGHGNTRPSTSPPTAFSYTRLPAAPERALGGGGGDTRTRPAPPLSPPSSPPTKGRSFSAASLLTAATSPKAAPSRMPVPMRQAHLSPPSSSSGGDAGSSAAATLHRPPPLPPRGPAEQQQQRQQQQQRAVSDPVKTPTARSPTSPSSPSALPFSNRHPPPPHGPPSHPPPATPSPSSSPPRRPSSAASLPLSTLLPRMPAPAGSGGIVATPIQQSTSTSTSTTNSSQSLPKLPRMSSLFSSPVSTNSTLTTPSSASASSPQQQRQRPPWRQDREALQQWMVQEGRERRYFDEEGEGMVEREEEEEREKHGERGRESSA